MFEMRNSWAFIALVSLILFTCKTLAQRPCTLDDYSQTYTKCIGNRRDLIYFLKKGVQCSGGVPLPTNKYDLQCDIACGEGEYLPWGAQECSKCAAGTFSFGGGYRQDSWTASWKTDIFSFTTWLVDKNLKTIEGSAWENDSQGQWIFSGANCSDSQSSIVEMPIRLITAGHIHFEYKVSCESKYDWFYFLLDGVVQLKATNGPSYKSFEMPLSPGYHTLQWKYTKDFSISEGDDGAFIKFIEIGGLEYADSECEHCPVGTYNPVAGAEGCLDCPENTYANTTGNLQCTPCDIHEYSQPGSTECQPRRPCDPSDIRIAHGPCTAPGQRTLSHTWIKPTVCDYSVYPLPGSEAIPCAPCVPGTYRDTDFQCKFCPTGYYSAGGDDTCHPCFAGTAAIKSRIWDEWDEFPENSTTGCTGDCATSGWRFLGDYIDSGTGHGVADSWFDLAVELNSPGSVTFNFSLINCGSCQLEFSDVGYHVKNFYRGIKETYTYNFETAGFHRLHWNLRHPATSPAQALIYSIRVLGVENGGAEKCYDCPIGSVSGDHFQVCEKCPVGTSTPAPKALICSSCPENTFNDVEGGACLPCGQGTTSPKGSVACSRPCNYTFILSEFQLDPTRVTYDLSPIPIAGSKPYALVDGKYTYSFELCGEHKIPCKNDENQILDTFICQDYSNGETAYALGKAISFHPWTEPRHGLVVTYLYGELCGDVPRTSNITFLCDPSAGVGSPVGGTFSSSKIENPVCNYNFVWKSLYGCPVCSTADYSFTLSDCDLSNKQRKIYHWNDSPKYCHSGVSLPQEELIDCVPQAYCPPGEVYDPFSATNCSPCGPGSYSNGQNVELRYWGYLPYDFSTVCTTPRCGDWQLENHYIRSGRGVSSLKFTNSFLIEGMIAFDYKIYASKDSNSHLQFFMDETELGFFSELSFTYRTASFKIPVGLHTFEWRYTDSSNEGKWSASISRIAISGTAFAAYICSLCPAGTFSASSNSTSCQICPANTFSIGGAGYCRTCGPGTFSLEEADRCLQIPACTEDNYQIYYTPCRADGTSFVRTKYEVRLEVCSGRAVARNQTVECAPCATGTFRQSDGSCTTCAAPGSTYSETDKTCKPVAPGLFNRKFLQYFIDNSLNYLPPPWETDCTGSCGTDGWRVRGDYIDSGVHNFDTDSAVDSWLVYRTTFAIDGRVDFGYNEPIASAEHRFSFFIDGVAVTLPEASAQDRWVSVPVPAGEHVFLWNYYQPPILEAPHDKRALPSDERYVVKMKRIYFFGTTFGISAPYPCPEGTYSPGGVELCIPCPVGHFSNSTGASACTPCPSGQFAALPKSTSCKYCGDGTDTNEPGQQFCTSSCKFSVSIPADATSTQEPDSITYDLSSLNPILGPLEGAGGMKFRISVCNANADFCRSSTNQSIPTYVCASNSTTNFDYGSVLNLRPNGGGFRRKGFRLEYSNPEPTHNCPQGTLTSFRFVCNPVVASTDDIAYEPSGDPCAVSFAWATIQACPVCGAKDYHSVYGLCVDGKQSLEYIKNNEYCNGPFINSTSIIDCLEVNIKDTQSSFPLAAVLVGIAALVLLIFISCALYIRSRRLSQKYSLLEQSVQARVLELDTKGVSSFSVSDDPDD